MSDRGCRACGCFLLILSFMFLFAGLLPFQPAETAAIDGSGAGAPAASPIETLSGMDLLNQGDPEALADLPGIGPYLAGEILKERTEHGPFWFPEDLMDVKGIGNKKMAQIRQILPETEDESEE